MLRIHSWYHTVMSCSNNKHNKRQHTAPAALARAAALVVGHMKFISKIAGITIALLLMTVAFWVASDISPYLYTKIYGDAGTEKLYQLYDIADDRVPLNEIMKFINANGIAFILHEKDGIIEAYIEHATTKSETVLVWHKNGEVTHVRFESFM